MKLRIVKHESPHDDYHVFDCEVEDPASWKAGMHAEFSIPGREIKERNTRYFSIASHPEEGRVKIATRIPDEPSEFKKCLAELKEGDELHMVGPYGEFHFRDDTTPVVMVAGGVGITPMRAMFKELEKGNQRPVRLIYSASGKHLFRDELQRIADADDNIEIHFVGGREEVSRLLSSSIDQYMSNAYYFVSGPPGMVRSMAMMLDDRFVLEAKVVLEEFGGYD